ncbi:hypothetical protein E2C01_099563 [Portunus trituberculatus]|uniref:Uncharacterized protein n=1 Tax=Portunus trituberculatus TaxID=210409 RepID=A0A5B7KH57_PORTR|nr:hypothetical protein [Portunus trituberculatus]
MTSNSTSDTQSRHSPAPGCLASSQPTMRAPLGVQPLPQPCGGSHPGGTKDDGGKDATRGGRLMHIITTDDAVMKMMGVATRITGHDGLVSAFNYRSTTGR